jgi:hypothetical protein
LPRKRWDPLLDEHYAIPDDERSGFQGLRRLAADSGLDDGWISKPLDLRRKLFHGLRATPDELRTSAAALVPALENLCIAGWKLVLKLDSSFPDESVVPHPISVRVDGVLTQKDESIWSESLHPFLEADFGFTRILGGDDREVTFQMTPKFTVRNTQGFRPTQMGLWGPTGYQALRWEGNVSVEERNDSP